MPRMRTSSASYQASAKNIMLCFYDSSRYDVPVKAGQMSANCAFLPDPSMVFETQEKCVGHFHVKNHLLSGHIVTEEFAVLEGFRIHQVLLPFEV